MASGHEQGEALKNACQYALTVQRALPNYICDETVRRYIGASQSLDVIEAQVTVIDGADSYSEIRVNGTPTDIKLLKLTGMWSSGEFGKLVPMLFAPDNRASFVFRKEEKLNSRPALLFSFAIRESENRSFFVWDMGGTIRKPGYAGSLWVDKETHRTIRLQAKSTWVRVQVGTGASARDYVELDTEYRDIPLADGTSFLLPAHSHLTSCREEYRYLNTSRQLNTTCNHNELEYTSCHKFRAKTKIVGVE
jgi:hypothetical protein